MTESAFQSKLLRALRQHPALRDAVIFKHSDRFNRGVPDFSVSINGNTTWFELKTFPNYPTEIQAYYLKRLKPRAFVMTMLSNGEIYFDDRTDFQRSLWDLPHAVEQVVRICNE